MVIEQSIFQRFMTEISHDSTQRQMNIMNDQSEQVIHLVWSDFVNIIGVLIDSNRLDLISMLKCETTTCSGLGKEVNSGMWLDDESKTWKHLEEVPVPEHYVATADKLIEIDHLLASGLGIHTVWICGYRIKRMP